MRFASSTRVRSFFVAVTTAAALGLLAASAGGCSSSNPLQGSCDRQAKCAEDNGWQFSASECEQEADFAFEKAKTAACDPALSAYAKCVDELVMSCDDDETSQAAKHCKNEASDLADCMQDAADSEAKDKSGSTTTGSSSSGGKSSSSSGGSSSGGSGSGGLSDYCDKMAECSNGSMSASSCKSSQSSATSAAEAAGCGDEFDALFSCAAGLDCSDLPSYTTLCKDEYDAYTSSCGH